MTALCNIISRSEEKKLVLVLFLFPAVMMIVLCTTSLFDGVSLSV